MPRPAAAHARVNELMRAALPLETADQAGLEYSEDRAEQLLGSSWCLTCNSRRECITTDLCSDRSRSLLRSARAG